MGYISAPANGSNGGETMPAGLICLWSGELADIPSGWAHCDGSNGTPNLVPREYVGPGYRVVYIMRL